MKLARVRLRNFRCYKDEVSIDIGKFTTLVGKNDSGKSTILDALSIFFEDSTPDADDGCLGGNKKDIRIICEFEDLPSSLVIDAGYKTSLAAEYLLNENKRLEIHKVYDGSLKKPKLLGAYAQALHPTAAGINDLLMLKNNELKERARKRSVDISKVDPKINSQLRQVIWASVPALDLAAKDVPLDAEGARKIWDQLKNHIPAFALFKSDRPSTDQDAEAQDPMKAAVKEAIKAKEQELKQISDYVEREVKAIADKTVERIREMDPGLARQLKPRFTPPNWANVFKISLTGDEEIPINKRGSGVRRLILLNFFRAKAEQQASAKDANGTIYAVEEPETSQHPDNQRMLMYALEELSQQPNCQVIVTTHTPTLGRLIPVESLRYLSIDDNDGRTVHAGDDETYGCVADALGVLPDHDVKLFIGVEGAHDINFLKGIADVLNKAGESVPDLNELDEKDHIIFIPCGGSNLALWKSRLAGLNRPEYHMFDRDVEPPAVPEKQHVVDEINLRPECKACFTGKREIENYLHPDAIKAARPEVDIAFGDFEDVPSLVAQAIHEASESNTAWQDLDEKKKGKKVSQAKTWLNAQAVTAMTPALLTVSDPNGDIRGWLAEISEIVHQ